LFRNRGRVCAFPFEGITEHDARDAINAATKIEEFVLKKIDLPTENQEELLDHIKIE